GREAGRLRAGQENRAQLVLLLGLQTALRHMLRLGPKRLLAARPILPPRHGRAVDAQRFGHVLYPPAALEQLPRPHPPPLQFRRRTLRSHRNPPLLATAPLTRRGWLRSSES